MSVINTNVNAQRGNALLGSTNLGLRESLEKLASGYKINKAADNPSDLAIATGMTSQIRGAVMAIQNAEDATNLIQTADGALNEAIEIVYRMRDLALRGANDAVITHSIGTFGAPSDGQKLMNEMVSLAAELDRKFQAASFNTKRMLSGALDPGVTTVSNLHDATRFAIQVGPDNEANMALGIVISDLVFHQFAYQGGNADMQTLMTLGLNDYNTAAFGGTGGGYMQGLVDFANSALNYYAQVRANLGVVARRLKHIISDTSHMNINISQSKSRINDTNFATETSQYTKLQILLQSGTAVLAQVNAQPQSVLQLLQ